MVGEGANLGLTQLARIDFNHRGGRLNTDAIDNSAGVNMSDYEVNLKILLEKMQKLKKSLQNLNETIFLRKQPMRFQNWFLRITGHNTV